MKTKQLSNPARVLIVIIAMLVLTIVSAKADMIKATYSPYKCKMDLSDLKDREVKISLSTSLDVLDSLAMRKFNFKNSPEEKKLKEEVRRYDVTSSKPRMLLTVIIPECEIPVYKII